MSIQDTTQALHALLPQLAQHTPEIHTLVSPLIPELRIIARKGLMGSRDRIALDLGNLVSQLTEICEFSAEGFENEDVLMAKTAMRALAIDLRVRTTALIKERTAVLRIAAEVSAVRADPDAAPVDFTEEYRVIAASPVTQFVRDGQVPRNFDLPESGGKIGLLEGDVYATELNDETRHSHDISPIDTLFLPEGRTITLHKSEMLILRVQGVSWGEKTLTYGGFSERQTDILVEAKEDDVVLTGPATFSLYEGRSLADQKNDLVHIKSNLDDVLLENSQFIHKTEESGDMNVFYGFMATTTAGVLSLAVMANSGISLVFVGCSLIPLISTSAHFMWARKRLSKFKQPLTNALHKVGVDSFNNDVTRIKNATFIDSKNLKTKDIASKITFINGLLFSANRAEFYPARKTIVRERQGIRVIEPLMALPAPQPELDLGTVIQMKTRA